MQNKTTPTNKREAVAVLIKSARDEQMNNASTQKAAQRAAESLGLAEVAFRAKDATSAQKHVEQARYSLSTVLYSLARESKEHAEGITQLESIYRAL